MSLVFATRAHYWLLVSLMYSSMPRTFSDKLLSSWWGPSLCQCMGLLFLKAIICTSLYWTSWGFCQLISLACSVALNERPACWPLPTNLASSTNLLRVPYCPMSHCPNLYWDAKQCCSCVDSWRMPLANRHQLLWSLGLSACQFSSVTDLVSSLSSPIN